MAKQTFTTGQVLTAAQMTSLQQTAMLGGDASAKVASYVLVAADAGTAITMSNGSATTITVNTGLFAAGDIVTIINLGAGVCTITAGTATVTTSGSLALAQNQGGVLRFTSASAAIFFQFATPASGDIEGVTAGTGLSGGGTSGTVTLSIASAQSDLVIKGFEEDVNVVASAATGTINFDVATASVWYYTSNASANHTLNFRYDGSNTLSSKLAVGDAITLVWLNTNGSTAYYPNVIQIDGSAVTPKVPAAISAGNASAIDAYVFTIIKTAATPTYTVLETQTKFA
jgi:hypothetical protein|tara:strand:+ start:1404 stop:2261 length:858 start_codon:yes stop_codon:yes gene_type:complete